MTQYTNEQLIEWLDNEIAGRARLKREHEHLMAIRARLTQSPPASPVAVQDGDEKAVLIMVSDYIDDAIRTSDIDERYQIPQCTTEITVKDLDSIKGVITRLTSRAQVDSQAVRDE